LSESNWQYHEDKKDMKVYRTISRTPGDAKSYRQESDWTGGTLIWIQRTWPNFRIVAIRP
jgi:hypothetical protein